LVCLRCFFGGGGGGGGGGGPASLQVHEIIHVN
jgi:hypothetical protein